MIGLLAGAALSLGVMSDIHRERIEEEVRASEMKALLGILEWHFLMSHANEFFTETIQAPSIEASIAMMRQDLVENGENPNDPHFRIHAVICGGTILEYLDMVPAESVVNLVFHADGFSDLVRIMPDRPMEYQDIKEMAFPLVRKEMRSEIREALFFGMSLIVVGGHVAFLEES